MGRSSIQIYIMIGSRKHTYDIRSSLSNNDIQHCDVFLTFPLPCLYTYMLYKPYRTGKSVGAQWRILFSCIIEQCKKTLGTRLLPQVASNTAKNHRCTTFTPLKSNESNASSPLK